MLPDAAIKLMRATKGLLLSVMDQGGYEEIEKAARASDVVHRLVGAHLSYRG